jgi:hypothetical protein
MGYCFLLLRPVLGSRQRQNFRIWHPAFPSVLSTMLTPAPLVSNFLARKKTCRFYSNSSSGNMSAYFCKYIVFSSN